MPWALIPALILLTIIAGLNFQRGDQWEIVIAWGVCAVICLGLPLRARQRFVAAWNSRNDHHHPVSWTFSDEGLFTETVNAKALHSWTAYTRVTITRDHVVLAQQGGQSFNFVPRRFFETEGDWLAVRQLLASKLPVRETGGR